MPSELLKCIICPKKPRFSDVSHLLTHVGSKGHLSHLHRLQVRSHQDLDAAHQTGLYNQWYQEYGMAALLSERMQQKEQKRAIKRAANAARMASTPIANKVRKPVSMKVESISLSSLLDQNCTPLRAPRDSSYPALPSSPPGLAPEEAVEILLSTEADVDAKTSPAGTPQLKGTQYPGMDLFDAAPEEQRKKRNQKKDSSVVRQLERYSTMVLPRETVTSAAGAVLKHRHMDDLENDSPVEGEDILRQATLKRRKQTKPRAPYIKKDKVENKLVVPKRRPGRPRKAVKTPSKAPDTSADEAEPSSFSLTPAPLESKAFVPNSIIRKKRSTFAVYQDSSPAFGVDGSSDVNPKSYADASTSRQQFAYPATLWRSSEPEPYDPFQLIRERFTPYPVLDELGQAKENSNLFTGGGEPQTHINPLLFLTSNSSVSVDAASSINRPNPISMANMDPFHDNAAYVPTRNPLMAAFERLRTPKQESFEYATDQIAELSTPYRQPVFAP